MEDTWSDDYVICPYCGEAYEPVYDPERSEYWNDGIYDIECDECGKTFELDTTVTYSWETARKED